MVQRGAVARGDRGVVLNCKVSTFPSPPVPPVSQEWSHVLVDRFLDVFQVNISYQPPGVFFETGEYVGSGVAGANQRDWDVTYEKMCFVLYYHSYAFLMNRLTQFASNYTLEFQPASNADIFPRRVFRTPVMVKFFFRFAAEGDLPVAIRTFQLPFSNWSAFRQEFDNDMTRLYTVNEASGSDTMDGRSGLCYLIQIVFSVDTNVQTILPVANANEVNVTTRFPTGQVQDLENAIVAPRNLRRLPPQVPFPRMRMRLPQGGCKDKIMDLLCDPRARHIETKRTVKGNSQGLVMDLNNLVVWCPNVKNNNCFFACVKYIVLHENKSLRSQNISHIVSDRVDSWRKMIGVNTKSLVDLQHIAAFVEIVLHRAVLIVDENLKEIAHIKPTVYNEQRVDVDGKKVTVRETKPLELVLFREHFFVLMRKSLQQYSCSTCGDRNIVKIDKHVCNASKVNYYQQAVKKHLAYFDKRVLQNADITDASLFDNMLFFDFETFFNGVKHQVYAVGLLHKTRDAEKYFSFTGPTCMETFMMYLEEMQAQNIALTLVSYNGCNFDHYFILENALTYNTALNEFLMNKGRLLQLNFMNHKVLDMYNFLGPSSLDANCESYGIQVRKHIFPHLYARKWEDIDYDGPPLGEEYYPDRMRPKYREWVKTVTRFHFMEECEYYLRLDVHCLKELSVKFITEMWNQFNIYVPFYITLSQLAFDMWRSTLNPRIRLPLPTDSVLYDMINKATYGGRCHFVKRSYVSPDLNKPYAEIQDYLVDWDVVSLYPSSMMSAEFPFGEMKRWNTKDDVADLNFLYRNKERLPIGIYEVRVRYVPSHMVIPPLPRKNAKGHTVWDNQLSDEIQCYTNIDLCIGLRYGYMFDFVSGYSWEESGELFTAYITDIFDRKAQQDVWKNTKDPMYNPAARDVFKKLMNALYGKLMQKRQVTDHKILDESDPESRTSWLQFLDSHANVEYQYMGDQMFMTGDRMNYSETITKPHYLGAFILSHSRVIMNTYYDMIDSERLKTPDTACWRTSLDNSMYYTDTDSLIVHSVKNDIIQQHVGSKLGMLSDELSGGKIIEGYFLSPKVYCVKYVKPDGSIHEKIRAKGIPNYLLTMQSFKNMYYDNDPTRFDFTQMRRLQEALNSTQEEQGMQPFTIVSVLDAHRTLNPNATYGTAGTLGGRKILENISDSVPLGFEAPKDAFDVLKLLEDEDAVQDEIDYQKELDAEIDMLFDTLRTQIGMDVDADLENYDD
jgi:hypothetical protein